MTTKISDMKPKNTPERARPPLPSLADRYAEGKALRNKVPRSKHAEWSPASDRPDPIKLLEESNSTRIPDLVPIRYGRMAVSPFTFLRGSANVMASDLSTTPTSGLSVQLCGDAHLSNFGVYASPERDQIFDVNDFDETLPGPWEWDVKRLAASILVAGRQNNFNDTEIRQAVLAGVETYRQSMRQYAGMHYLDVWYARIDLGTIIEMARYKKGRELAEEAVKQSRRRTSSHVFPKLTEIVDGQCRIKDEPPLIFHYKNLTDFKKLLAFGDAYISSLPDERRVLSNRFRALDIAQKVVGVGSVGTLCAIALFEGNNGLDDPLFLQIKEAQASVLEPYIGISEFKNHGQRVVVGQRLTQAASDIFLGWSSFEGKDCYVRQLRDMKWSVEIEQLNPKTFMGYARVCGMALALGHARSGDPAKISGYLGGNEIFSQAIVDFSEAYADQTQRDHADLLAAIKKNKVKAIMDV